MHYNIGWLANLLLTDTLDGLLEHFRDDYFTKAAGSGLSVFREMLDHIKIRATEEVAKAAAGNERSGKEVMMLLLKERGNEFEITEEVVKAAAGNGSSGKEVMMLLLEEPGNEIEITEEVVKAAAANNGSG